MPEPTASVARPSTPPIVGTPRRPAMAPRRGLFVGLLVAYALVIIALVAMSLRQYGLM